LPAEKITHFYACQIATTNSVKQHKLRKRIASLSDKEGRGKEFISLYIPPETPIDQVIANLKKKSEVMMRESQRLRERFQNALKNIIQQLKEHKEIPENGLALFAGTLVTNGTDEVLSVEEIVPPEPIITYLYAVDVYFRLETLREMLRDQKIVGILALDSKEANFGLLNGEHLKLMKNITSGLSGKTTKGGQSQRRYERERDMTITHFSTELRNMHPTNLLRTGLMY